MDLRLFFFPLGLLLLGLAAAGFRSGAAGRNPLSRVSGGFRRALAFLGGASLLFVVWYSPVAFELPFSRNAFRPPPPPVAATPAKSTIPPPPAPALPANWPGTAAEPFPRAGMWIVQVDPGSEADQAGLTTDTVLISLAGETIVDQAAANRAVARSLDTPIAAVVWQGGRLATRTVVPRDAFIGVTLCHFAICPGGKRR